METKNSNSKSFGTVKTFRAIKDKISKDIQGMSFEQLKAYLAERTLKPPAAY